MNRVFKTLLLWLLMAALPIQGMAAVVKASCGSRHHAMQNAAPVAAQVVEHHHDAGSASHAHHAFDTVSAGEPGDGSPDVKPVQKTSYCSACATCCIGAAAPPPTVFLASIVTSVEAAIAPPVISFTGFIPAGLERPPRPHSA